MRAFRAVGGRILCYRSMEKGERSVQTKAQDMLPLLRSMNIDPMPRSRAGENEGQAMRGALYLRFNLRLAESTDEEIENTGGASRAGNDGPTLTFSRPFVWWISDAASDAPFLFAGITEAP